jgi:hypothetical protein
MSRFIRIASLLLAGALTVGVPWVVHAQSTWSEISTGAAAGYCLARHPFINLPGGNRFTSEGFEIAASPGVVGAVRRNYVFNRGAVDFATVADSGSGQHCVDACRQWGLNWNSKDGKPLRYRSSTTSTPIADGIGDMAATAHPDADFYLRRHDEIAGISGRPLNYHEADVAQADFCCCHLSAN